MNDLPDPLPLPSQLPQLPPTTDERIAAVLEKLAAAAPVEEIGFGHPKYQERLHKEGFYATLEKPAFQNGRDIEPRGLKPDTIHRLARLKSGTYIGGRVQVEVDNKGRTYLTYKSATPEQRMAFQQHVRDFDHLIDRIWSEIQAAKLKPTN